MKLLLKLWCSICLWLLDSADDLMVTIGDNVNTWQLVNVVIMVTNQFLFRFCHL